MNGETWTEYAVRDGAELVWRGSTLAAARWRAQNIGGTVVGRTVTATPWLPAQDQP